MIFDVAFLGHYTKDTIVTASGTRVVDGGAFNYGAQVAARMGLRVAAITRLAHEDFHVVDALERLGVEVLDQDVVASRMGVTDDHLLRARLDGALNSRIYLPSQQCLRPAKVRRMRPTLAVEIYNAADTLKIRKNIYSQPLYLFYWQCGRNRAAYRKLSP